ncbi:MAG: hypothetical protein JW821_07035 [Deltaproteobacteria bacterium]|nr:hypothetical protein [Deltaproteobacteria bacterium]
MEFHLWIVGQIIVDVIMLGLLLWFVRTQGRVRISWQEQEKIVQRAEILLAEMHQISQVLEKNLQEKKELSQRILEQLEQGLKRARDTYREISRIVPGAGAMGNGPVSPAKDSDRTRSSVNTLLGKGLSKEEIAQHLGISVAEIELLLKLSPKKAVTSYK